MMGISVGEYKNTFATGSKWLVPKVESVSDIKWKRRQDMGTVCPQKGAWLSSMNAWNAAW